MMIWRLVAFGGVRAAILGRVGVMSNWKHHEVMIRAV
jgi:hypothetical protein